MAKQMDYGEMSTADLLRIVASGEVDFLMQDLISAELDKREDVETLGETKEIGGTPSIIK